MIAYNSETMADIFTWDSYEYIYKIVFTVKFSSHTSISMRFIYNFVIYFQSCIEHKYSINNIFPDINTVLLYFNKPKKCIRMNNFSRIHIIRKMFSSIRLFRSVDFWIEYKGHLHRDKLYSIDTSKINRDNYIAYFNLYID